MRGRRVDAANCQGGFLDGQLPLNEGDYGRDSNGNWYGKPPGFKPGYANLSKHDVVEHDDGTITVTPSILVTTHNAKWHGYLERGIWREC